MSAITDMSDLVNLATGGNSGAPENSFFQKQARIAGVTPTTNQLPIAGRPMSLWTYDGQPGAGVAPTSVAIPTNSTAGALQLTNPAGGKQKWLTQFFSTGLVAGTLVLYDRLLHIGGLNGTTTTAQTVGGTLTRYTNGIGNLVWAEIYTLIGASASSITMSYTDETGTSGTANSTSPSVLFGATNYREQTRCIMLPLAAGDKGVKYVASVTHATTGTAGNYGITIGHPLAYVTIGGPGLGGWRDFVSGQPGMPEILTNACLALLWYPQTTTVPEFTGGIAMVEK